MMILTARIYAVYWAYKNFLALDTTPAKRPQILAGINSVLIVFRFNHLMKLIEAEGAKHDVPVKFPRIFYLICLFVIIPVIGGVLAYYAVPFGFVVPVVLTTWLFSKPNEALLKINAHLAPQARVDTEFTRYNYMLIAVVLAFIFFHPLDKFDLSPSHWLAEQKLVQRCRWIYDDPNDKTEQEWKARRIKAMDRFWENYKSKGDKMFDPETNMASDVMLDSSLISVHPKFRWKAQKSVDAQNKPHYDVTIYTHAGAAYFPIIRTMVSRAPKSSDCNYYWCEQPVPPEKIQETMSAQESFVLNSFQAKCHLTKSNLIEVEITSPDFADKDEYEKVRLATTISYFVLGQESLSTWLGKVTAKQGPSDIKPTSAAREFKSDFELLKMVALNKLPDKYFYELKGQSHKYFTPDNSKDALDTNKPPEPDFVPNVLLAVMQSPFDSCRFSKNGEKIVAFSTRTPIKDEATDQKIFEDGDNLLIAQKAGRVFMGYREDGSLKLLCVVNDVAKAKQTFKELCDKHELSHQSWLLFLDVDMSNEQIGLFSDTKKYEWNENVEGNK